LCSSSRRQPALVVIELIVDVAIMTVLGRTYQVNAKATSLLDDWVVDLWVSA